MTRFLLDFRGDLIFLPLVRKLLHKNEKLKKYDNERR